MKGVINRTQLLLDLARANEETQMYRYLSCVRQPRLTELHNDQHAVYQRV